jgi:hypothetical protein
MDNLESMLYQLRLELVAIQARITELERHDLEQDVALLLRSDRYCMPRGRRQSMLGRKVVLPTES